MRLGRVRELTAPPPSLQTGETMAAAVQALIELGQRQVVEAGL